MRAFSLEEITNFFSLTVYRIRNEEGGGRLSGIVYQRELAKIHQKIEN